MSARLVALQLLSDILDKGHTLDQALDSSSAFRYLSSRDRAFARMLLTTTIRRLGEVDHLIIQMSDRGEAPSPPVLHHILRLGPVQIFFMDVPIYGPVDTSVRMIEERGLPRLKGDQQDCLRQVRAHRAH